MTQNQRITKSVRKEDAQHEWWVVDAAGQTVGRLATQVATLLRGKHKPSFTPHVDCGDFVVVVNADQIVLQGKRTEQKTYFHYTGYPGGGRVRTFQQLKDNKPEEIVELAVRGMLPKTSLGKAIGKKLKVYRGSEHPHEAQQPKPFALKA
ncbi:MAG: 50S ribosomal protein L13 [Bradyrhizobiaceae bacterium]|nr:50S ribosomal protein L13 [Bradyrhizobiaceae bacterium]